MDHPEHAKKAFPADLLERIAHTIADVEESTGAEIRISIRDLRDAGEADLSLKELAQKEFGTLGMHHHGDRLGILLLILYHERKFFVYGDEGVNTHVDTESWNDVAATLKSHFAKVDYEGGLREALKRIENHLKGKLPKRKEGMARLSDEVVVR